MDVGADVGGFDAVDEEEVGAEVVLRQVEWDLEGSVIGVVRLTWFCAVGDHFNDEVGEIDAFADDTDVAGWTVPHAFSKADDAGLASMLLWDASETAQARATFVQVFRPGVDWELVLPGKGET